MLICEVYEYGEYYIREIYLRDMKKQIQDAHANWNMFIYVQMDSKLILVMNYLKWVQKIFLFQKFEDLKKLERKKWFFVESWQKFCDIQDSSR